MAIGLMLTYITQCWLLKMDQKLCLQHDSKGVPITSFRNHLYGVTLIRHRKKLGVFNNVEEATLVECIKQMQRIGHPITLT